MKITNIEKKDNIYFVTLEPNWFERIFGVKSKIKKFKATGGSYLFGGGSIYITENGHQTDNGYWIAEEIDTWKRKF